MDTSASLLQRVRERGDDADWQRLVWLYTPLIRTWVGRHVRQPDDVNDLVQQVFTVVVAKLSAFVHSGRPGAFRHWLRSITANHLRPIGAPSLAGRATRRGCRARTARRPSQRVEPAVGPRARLARRARPSNTSSRSSNRPAGKRSADWPSMGPRRRRWRPSWACPSMPS